MKPLIAGNWKMNGSLAANEALVKATELAFGLSGAPRYAVDEAKVIVGFGADFLQIH